MYNRALSPTLRTLRLCSFWMLAACGVSRGEGDPSALDGGEDGAHVPQDREAGPRDGDASPAVKNDGAIALAEAGGPARDAAADTHDAQTVGDAAIDTSMCSPSTEVCNLRDDDCDGIVDDGCVDGLNVLDFDLTAPGNVVAVGHGADGIPQIVCLHADGAVARGAQVIATPELGHTLRGDLSLPTLAYIDVARARDAGNIAVTWVFWNSPATTNDWRLYVAFYDAQCNRVRGPAALDEDLPNAVSVSTPSLIARYADVFMTKDGRSYFLYEHQTARQFRALAFDPSGSRTAAVTLSTSTDCAGGARTRVLALDAASGKFAVACESPKMSERVVRRYMADGSAIDPTFVAVPDSAPTGFTFHYFGIGLNASGSLLYYGRTSNGSLSTGTGDPPKWILRGMDGTGQIRKAEVGGGMGANNPRTRVTSRGDFLIELGGLDYQLALAAPSGEILRTFPKAPKSFELDAEDRVWVHKDGRIFPDEALTLYP